MEQEKEVAKKSVQKHQKISMEWKAKAVGAWKVKRVALAQTKKVEAELHVVSTELQLEKMGKVVTIAEAAKVVKVRLIALGTIIISKPWEMLISCCFGNLAYAFKSAKNFKKQCLFYKITGPIL